MKLRVISDLHIDINNMYPIDLHSNGANDVYTLIAGDICGSPSKAIEWVKKNVHHGAFISGNHDVYDTDLPIEEVKEKFHNAFPENSNVVYFDNDVGVLSKEIADGVLLVADVLYTDYALPIAWRNASGDVDTNMALAHPYKNLHGGMNDFVYGKCKRVYKGWNDVKRHAYANANNMTWRLCPPWCLEHHKKAMQAITDVVESNKDKQILLMTHQGMSPKCLDDNYHEDSSLDASYVSDKEEWVKAHPNIKCIVSGHVHCRKKFMVGNCLYVMNALGYCNRHLKQWDNETQSWQNWTLDCFIDTDTWTVEWKHSENKEWEEQHSKATSKLSCLIPFIF